MSTVCITTELYVSGTEFTSVQKNKTCAFTMVLALHRVSGLISMLSNRRVSCPANDATQ